MAETLRVLVADDEAGMRHAVARALRSFRLRLPDVEGEIGFEIEQAESGEAALSRLAEPPRVDILLVDHKMGGMTGVEVLDALRQRESDVLAIMITAFATLETAIRATRSGAFDFLAKPFTPEELRETVRKAAGHLVVQREARRLAAERRRVRFEFISILAHELKAPLGAIEGYLNIIRDQAMGSDVTAYRPVVERCLVRAGGMRKLIMDLLDMTRIESGARRRELAPVRVREVVDACVDTVRPDADGRQITIAVECPAELVTTADRSELEIILNNLVSNAVKYNRDQGRVELRVSADDTYVEIRVSDTGIGLTREEADRLFGDFVRIKNDKTRHILGSGLGLSVVRKLARMYGGDATVESTPDVGSTFTVRLRRDGRGEEAAGAAPTISHADASTNPELAARH